MAVEAYHTAEWIKKGLIPTERAAAILLNNSSESLITEKKSTIQAAQEIPLHTTQALPIYGCNH